MENIKQRTLQEIKRRFKTDKGYILSDENPIYCPQVNGLVNICLTDLGLMKEAQDGCQRFLRSSSFDSQTGLFHSAVDSDGRVIDPALNSGKNLIFALALAKNGFKKEARELMRNVLESPFYDGSTGLFNSSFSDSNVNTTKSTYKNSFVALALKRLGYNPEFSGVVRGLVRDLYDSKEGLFYQSTKNKVKVSDNSALALVALES